MDWNAFGTWLGVAVSVSGFSIAIAQIRKTRSAAEAAARAVTQTEIRIARNALLAILPQLLQMELEFGSQLAAARAQEAAGTLARWRHVAAQVRGLLDRAHLSDAQVDQLLADAITLAASAEQALSLGRSPANLSVREARQAISDGCSAASTLLAALQAYTEE